MLPALASFFFNFFFEIFWKGANSTTAGYSWPEFIFKENFTIEQTGPSDPNNGNKSCLFVYKIQPTNMHLFALNVADRCVPTYVSKMKRGTLVINEDITIKTVPEQQNIICVFEVDVRPGEQVGIETVKRKKTEL